jgi:hypothetical protein
LSFSLPLGAEEFLRWLLPRFLFSFALGTIEVSIQHIRLSVCIFSCAPILCHTQTVLSRGFSDKNAKEKKLARMYSKLDSYLSNTVCLHQVVGKRKKGGCYS